MINLSEIKHWIFDLDGTLTVKVHDFLKIRETLGIPATEDILGYLSRLPSNQADPLIEKLDRIETDLAHKTSPSAGAVALVETLYKKQLNMGILTRNTKENAHISLSKMGMDTYFPDECVLGREGIKPKPDPEGINALLDLWKGSPKETAIVGDYLYDLQAGKNAGTYTVYVDPEEKYPWSNFADVQVKSLENLMLVNGL